MPPNTASPTGRVETGQHVVESTQSADDYKQDILWLNVILHIIIQVHALYGIYLMFTSASLYTTVFVSVLYMLAKLGVTAGAHRLWCHRSYKAKLPLQIMLTFFNTLAFQEPVVHWARIHRLHHKHCDTDADPHNAKRGIFYCHVGWLLCRRHPVAGAQGKAIDMTDLTADPILRFQKKYYKILMPVICFILPTLIPIYFWNESFINAYTMNLLRFAANLHSTWLVNSAAHMFGSKPFDRFISGSQNLAVSMLALGEGWHNYHHAFPWDYKAAELGIYSTNWTTGFIDLMAKIGWAYDLRSVSPNIIRKRVKRTGDGSHYLWGWGDKDMPKDEKNETVVSYKQNH